MQADPAPNHHAMERAMAAKLLPSAERIRQLMTYDPGTGICTWKPRTEAEYGGVMGLASWNTRFAKKKAGAVWRGRHYSIGIDGVRYPLHRIIWKMQRGVDPGVIDHIDGDGFNNAWLNLRDTDQQENCRNRARGKANKSGTVGVSFENRSGTWVAYIGVGEVRVRHLGRFPTKEEAIKARKAAEIALGYHPNHGR